MADQIVIIERRRYIELAKQAAYAGSHAEPAILIELADLRQKYGPVELLDSSTLPQPDRRRANLDLDWLTVNYAALFRRMTSLEAAVKFGRVLDVVQIILLVMLLSSFALYVMGRL